jgi:hypothetical protein
VREERTVDRGRNLNRRSGVGNGQVYKQYKRGGVAAFGRVANTLTSSLTCLRVLRAVVVTSRAQTWRGWFD